MQFTTDRLSVDMTSTGCDIPADERTRLQAPLEALADRVNEFVDATLSIHVVFHPRRAVYHAEFKLKLPGRTLFTGAEDPYMDSALLRCFAKLNHKVDGYREHPNEEAIASARRRAQQETDMIAPEDPAVGPIAQAAEAGDYRAFRNALADYEIWLGKRVGRMVQRYPAVEALLNNELLIGDFVEEVYLNAFEQFTQRPTEQRLSEWLDGLIETSIRNLSENFDEEKTAVDFARTTAETPME